MKGYTLTGAGCRDNQGKFVPVSQCTGRRPTRQKPLGGSSAVKMKIGDTMCVNGRKLRRFKKGVRFIKGKCTGRKRILTRGR